MGHDEQQQGKGATRGRLVALLRRGRRSVEELARALGLTDNAVRAQLQALQQDGVARAVEVRRDGSVGKPAVLYDIAPAAEPRFSRAYAPVFAALLTELGARSDPAEVESLLRAAGRRLAQASATEATDDGPMDAEARAGAARDLLGALGAEADLERTPDGFVIRGHACPLSEAVCAAPAVCAAVEELLGGVVGLPVRECCDRADRPKCCFHIMSPAA